jgi:polysaccharide export outer membrane protein
MYFRRLFISSLTLVFISFLILSGCATTEPTSEAIQPPSEEISKEIKLTEFILGPGDVVEISVYRHDELKRTTAIDSSGKITYPLIGDVQAGGLSIFQLRDNIQKGLSEYIKEPQVSVSVTAVRSRKVYVLGEVGKPGVFAFQTQMSAIESISLAGGFTIHAQDKSVMVIRGDKDNPQLIKLDLRSALRGGNAAQNIQLQGGDTVFVPATYIADVSKFAVYLSKILWPISLFTRDVVWVTE